jgi:alcohol dehydrogenase YqhD (iron-dependent ADH family)
MKNFSFYNPTRIEFGKGKEENIGLYISEYGVTKVLIVYGSDRIKKNGLFDKVAKSLKISGINYVELGGVQSNPILSKVYEGIEIAKTKGIEACWLLAAVRYWTPLRQLQQVPSITVMYGISLLSKLFLTRH